MTINTDNKMNLSKSKDDLGKYISSINISASTLEMSLELASLSTSNVSSIGPFNFNEIKKIINTEASETTIPKRQKIRGPSK